MCTSEGDGGTVGRWDESYGSIHRSRQSSLRKPLFVAMMVAKARSGP